MASPSPSPPGDDLGALVSAAIAAAAKKLRAFLDDDYARYESALLALDVVEAQLRALPLGGGGRGRGEGDDDDDPDVRVARLEWKLRLDGATNELEDLVGEMEAAVEAETKAARWCWAPWRRRRCRAAAEVVAGWLRSDARNKVRMELAVGRLAGVYVQGGELFDDDDEDDVAGDGDGTAASQCRDGGACQPDGMAGETTKAWPTRTNTSSSSSPPAMHNAIIECSR
uniref:Uncharacterized protein n=1 Tax=Oryza glumipatula TaxID=40148 RepID=A0A0E0AKP4_9ORYZ